MRPPASPWRTAFPVAVNLAWFWGGMVILLLLAVRWILPPSEASPDFVQWALGNPWRESGAPARLLRIQVLLTVWLWITHWTLRLTDPDRQRRGLVGLLAAGLLLVVLAQAILLSARPPTSGWGITRLHPGNPAPAAGVEPNR